MFAGLTDLKVRLGVTGSGSDAPLTAALTAADAAVRACLNFSPEGWTGTEFVSGTDTPRLSLARPNVTAVYRVCVAAGWGDGGYAPGAFDAAADLTAGTDYALDGDLLVRLRGAVWPAGRRVRPGSLAAEPGGAGGNVLVRYSAGGDAGLLAACEQATLLEAAALWQSRFSGLAAIQGAGVDGVSVTLANVAGSGGTVTYGLSSPLAATLLRPWRRRAIGGLR